MLKIILIAAGDMYSLFTEGAFLHFTQRCKYGVRGGGDMK